MGCVSSAPEPKKSRHQKPADDGGNDAANGTDKALDESKRSPDRSGTPQQEPSAPPKTADTTTLPSSAAVQQQPTNTNPYAPQNTTSNPYAPQNTTTNPYAPSAPAPSTGENYAPPKTTVDLSGGPPPLPGLPVFSEFDEPEEPEKKPLPGVGYTEAEFMLSEYGIEDWEAVKAEEDMKTREKRLMEEDRRKKAAEKEKKRNSKPCKHFGSARGCRNGASCRFSHDNPNGIRKCKHYPYCRKGQKCGFRHHEFQFSNGVWIAVE